MPDKDVQRVRREGRVVAPDPLVDQAACEDLAWMAEEELEQLELDRAQLDLPLSPPSITSLEVELEIGECEIRGLRDPARGTSQQGAESGNQLFVRERLHEIVVGARLEAHDAIADSVPRG